MLLVGAGSCYAALDNKKDATDLIKQGVFWGAAISAAARRSNSKLLTDYFQKNHVIDTQPANFTPDMRQQQQKAKIYLDKVMFNHTPIYLVSAVMLPNFAFVSGAAEFAQSKNLVKNLASGKWALVPRDDLTPATSRPEANTPPAP